MNILIIDSGQPFNLDSLLIEPLGGSESSVLLLAQGLSLHHNVVITTSNNKGVPQIRGNLNLFHISEAENIVNEADVIILNRCLPPFIKHLNKSKKVFYYTHDAYDQTHIILPIKEYLNDLTGILFVSNYQKESFKTYLNIEHQNSIILNNSINYNHSLLYSNLDLYKDKDKINLIYCSIPYKGIEILYDIFNTLLYKYKDIINLNLNIFSSMAIYNQADLDKKYEEYYNNLSQLPNTKLNNPISQYQLVSELAKSHILLMPSLYHETFGINSILAQSVGCIPILPNNGANSEINLDFCISNNPNIKSKLGFEAYIDKISEIIDLYINNPTQIYQYQKQLIQNSKQFDYQIITNKFIEVLCQF